ncbi:MAG: hypothetical protein JW889_11100 [Verrucomicrobia bacterium]|nr:hypothetical protein [Verrucomicrobiota bacterium]
MGKVRLIIGIVVLVILFVFALFNSDTANIQFFLKKWTVPKVPVWGIIYITLAIGLLVGYILRGGHKKKKEQS